MNGFDIHSQLSQYNSSNNHSSSSSSRSNRYYSSNDDKGYSSSSNRYPSGSNGSSSSYKSRSHNDHHSSSNSSRDNRYKPYSTSNYKQDKQMQYERGVNRYSQQQQQQDSPYCVINAFLEADPILEKKLFNKASNVIDFDLNGGNIDIKATGSNVPNQVNTFDECFFHEIVNNSIKLSQYKLPTPVQQHAMPIIIAKRDLMACAQTGSGKTAAFLMPILNSIYHTTEAIESFKVVNGVKKWQPLALILAPTRELALQIYDEAKKFAYRSNLRSFVVYGGADIRMQMRNLDQTGCHLLVATPGRLIDLYNKEIISFENIKYLVLDEADRMLDMGFEPQIREIVQQKNMPSTNRQTLLFSATFPKQIQIMAKDFLNDYIFLAVGRVGSTNLNIKQRIVWAPENEKHSCLLNILTSNPETLTLIFVETRRSCDELEKYLQSKYFQAVSIHGKKSQTERERALNLFRNGHKLVLVATAVAARGLDISNVKIVVNFDVPNDIDDYVHRIGRTGRAGSSGEAISFFNEKNKPIANDLFNLLNESQQEIPPFLASMMDNRRYGSNNNNNKRFDGRNNRHEYNDYRQNGHNSRSRSSNGGNSNGRDYSSSSYKQPQYNGNGNGYHNSSYSSYNDQAQQQQQQQQTKQNDLLTNNAYLAFLLPQLPPPPPPPEY